MLKLLTSDDISRLQEFCENSILGTRIACYALSYGFDRDFLMLWGSEADNKFNCIIAKFDGNMTILSDETADFEEIREFIEVIGADTIATDKETADKLKFTEYELKTGFFYDEYAVLYKSEETAYIDDLKKVYELISDEITGSFPKTRHAYLSFLSDFTYRQRRGYATVKCIRDNGRIVACGLTASQSETDVVLSGIACDRAYRNSGYGKRIVLSLAQEFKSTGRNVFVIALNSSAEGFYKHVGFKECAEIAFIKKG